jgi:hypothetical protein
VKTSSSRATHSVRPPVETVSVKDSEVVRLLGELAREEMATIDEQALDRCLVESQPFLRCLGMREHGKLVALAMYCNSFSITDQDQPTFSVDLLDLIVTNAHRRKGYGSALIEKLQECSLKQERSAIRWSLFENNLAANSFYKFLDPAQRSGNKFFLFPRETKKKSESSQINWKETSFDCGLKLRLEDRKGDWFEAVIFPSFDASLPGTIGEIGMVSHSSPSALEHLAPELWDRIAERTSAHWNARYLVWHEHVLLPELLPTDAQLTKGAVHFSSELENFSGKGI